MISSSFCPPRPHHPKRPDPPRISWPPSFYTTSRDTTLSGLSIGLVAPRRHLEFGRGLRWPNNLGVVVVDTLVLRLVVPTAAVGLALVAEAQGWGLFNAFAVPGWLAVIASVILLDLHAVPVPWRLRRMHHADLGFDVSTGLRFHPIEILLSMVIKLTVVAALGAPALGVLLFEVLLNATSMFNHGNVRMPERLDRVLRWIVVTPDMQRVHHSATPRETNGNFGFNLAWWDRLSVPIARSRRRGTTR